MFWIKFLIMILSMLKKKTSEQSLIITQTIIIESTFL